MAFYQSLERPPSFRFATAQLCRAISSVSGFDIVPVVVPDMEELRGMLMTFTERSGFDRFVEDHPLVREQTPQDLKFDKGVGLVLLSDANNPCWQRFTVIKEASHLYWESDNLLKSTDIGHLAKAVVDWKVSDDSDKSLALDPDNVELFVRDHFGILAALELLLPESSLRSWMEHEVNVKRLTTYQLAYTLKLPQRFVSIRMEQWGIEPVN